MRASAVCLRLYHKLSLYSWSPSYYDVQVYLMAILICCDSNIIIYWMQIGMQEYLWSAIEWIHGIKI